ncbi:HD domain-containing phosphohydrolase [Winogradskya humida]|uniref:Response regulator receiver modulated metal-depenent phosphohydrolase n=1 Tax=Winogradskya humida TaxID=113566 RepID=A0ABQ3ZWJ4_9ACTN|nr:HD domain-containing phosphohydrolase [Actinoplanes humidus]GIE22950.1 response regulator receiver modulated metal-depenent phosphohydrolase [Actinoplanes humidus]
MTTLPKILLVDDEPNLLNGLRRQLRRDFEVVTAVGAANGLFSLKDGPFEVIVSDFLMPGINGAEFLAAVRKSAPDATRMLLTGHTNLADAASTVNDGGIFRMLLKPVDQETMTAALRDCVAQYRLVTGQRELLEQTLHGSVKALMDVLALANPAAFARASRMRRTAAAVLDRVPAADRWAVELAVMMSQLGAVSLPPAVTDKLSAGGPLTEAEQRMLDEVPDVAERLIAGIPRLTVVTDAIRGSRAGTGEDVPYGARLLRLVRDYDLLVEGGATAEIACLTLQAREGWYDPALLAALTVEVRDDSFGAVTAVALQELGIGMVLAAGVHSGSGTLLVHEGQEVTPSLLSRLQNFASLDDGVAEPLMVRTVGADVTVAELSAIAR